jgi:hypothetical protein
MDEVTRWWLEKHHLQKFFGSFFQKRTGSKRFFLKKEGKTFYSFEGRETRTALSC